MKIGLSNFYVNNLCKKLIGNYFIGTFACDKLNKKAETILSRIKRNKPFCLIVNLSPSHHKGTHFVAISYRNSKIVLFDSLALNYEDPNITAFLNRISNQHQIVKFTTLKS